MKNEKSVRKDASNVITAQRDSENKSNSMPFYPKYWYTQNDLIWKALNQLQHDHNELKAKVNGEY